MNLLNKKYSVFRKLFMVSFGCTAFFNNIIAASTLFMTSYALFLGASNVHIGILAAIPSLTATFQVFSAFLFIKFKSRKRLVCWLTALQYIFFYFIILIPKISTGQYQIYLLLFAFFSGFILRSLIGGGLLEWNNFFVPAAVKGSYFSTRNILNNATYIVMSLIVGNILDKYDGKYIGYFVILGITLMFSIIEIVSLLKIDDYSEDLAEKPMIKFQEIFTLPLKDRRYMSYVYFAVWWGFAVSLASPYFTVYSVKYLDLKYSYIAIIGSVTGFLKILVARLWGTTGDRKGWRNIVLFAGSGYALTNMVWFFVNAHTTFLYPFIIVSNGIFMIGINIAIFNLNLELSSEEHRIIYLGFNTMIGGIFAFIGPLISAWVINALKNSRISLMFLQINGYQIMFLVSSLLLLLGILYIFRVAFNPRAELNQDKRHEAAI